MQDFPEVSWMRRYCERVNADPEMELIGGCSRLAIMKGMGHFPMVENYPGFRPFLLRELEFMAGG